MAKGYWVTSYRSVSNPTAFSEYAQAALKVLGNAVERETRLVEGA